MQSQLARKEAVEKHYLAIQEAELAKCTFKPELFTHTRKLRHKDFKQFLATSEAWQLRKCDKTQQARCFQASHQLDGCTFWCASLPASCLHINSKWPCLCCKSLGPNHAATPSMPLLQLPSQAWGSSKVLQFLRFKGSLWKCQK